MRKILVFSAILFFCSAGLSLAEKKIPIRTFGAAPLYRNLDSPERAKEILLKYKEAVKRAIADDFIYQALYARIEGATIKKSQIYPGQEILWMLYAGKKAEEVRMLRYVKWSGNETVDVYTVFIPYEVIDGNDMYECYAEFILPKPCGNISLLKTGCTLIEPEPEPEPEQVRPKLKPEPPLPPLPEQKPKPRLKPEPRPKWKPKLEFRAFYPILFFQIEPPTDIDLFREREWILGEWFCWTRDNDVIYIWTDTELELLFQQNGTATLEQSRQSTRYQVGVPFGLGIAFYPVKQFALTFSYNQSAVYQVDTVEKYHYFYFEQFAKIDNSEYEMKLDEFYVTQNTTEQFSFQNFTAGLKVEIQVYEITKLFVGAGVDFLKANRTMEKQKETRELIVWSEDLDLTISEQTETKQIKQSEWRTRLFLGAGFVMDVLKDTVTIRLGAEGKYFFLLQQKDFEFQKEYLFPVDSDTWKLDPKNYRVEVFAAIRF